MTRTVPRILFLHGFASSPNSRKARFFGEKLATEGLALEVLDLAQGDFAGLTLSGQLGVVERAADGEAVVLIGSSMGGYLAALYAARHAEVSALILMAPAFGFHRLWEKEVGPEKLAEWREKGTIRVFHYGEGAEMDLKYGLMRDAAKYEEYPEVSAPCLVFHGLQDPVVPVAASETFARGRSNVRLIEVESGHELMDVLDEIWEESKPFLLNRTYEKESALEVI
jgi:uncharacterized protein